VSPDWLFAVPVPVPFPARFKVYDTDPWPEKLALTFFDCSMVRRQVGEVPLHAPLQPVKVLPDPAVAVRTTVDFQPYVLVQSVGSYVPAAMAQRRGPVSPTSGAVTVPTPVPPPVTVSVRGGLVGLKLGVVGSELSWQACRISTTLTIASSERSGPPNLPIA
jgi:hypothetical protein